MTIDKLGPIDSVSKYNKTEKVSKPTKKEKSEDCAKVLHTIYISFSKQCLIKGFFIRHCGKSLL